MVKLDISETEKLYTGLRTEKYLRTTAATLAFSNIFVPEKLISGAVAQQAKLLPGRPMCCAGGPTQVLITWLPMQLSSQAPAGSG